VALKVVTVGVRRFGMPPPARVFHPDRVVGEHAISFPFPVSTCKSPAGDENGVPGMKKKGGPNRPPIPCCFRLPLQAWRLLRHRRSFLALLLAFAGDGQLIHHLASAGVGLSDTLGRLPVLACGHRSREDDSVRSHVHADVGIAQRGFVLQCGVDVLTHLLVAGGGSAGGSLLLRHGTGLLLARLLALRADARLRPSRRTLSSGLTRGTGLARYASGCWRNGCRPAASGRVEL